jgi:hypothetical protein
MFSIRRWIVVGSVVTMLAALPTSQAKADPVRDFVVSCSYGVLAGTIVGAASLAFTNQPGQNLNNVARGASIGLYAGILLGAYVVYGVPAEEEEDAKAQLNRVSVNRVQIYPLISQRGIEGGATTVRLLSF